MLRFDRRRPGTPFSRAACRNSQADPSHSAAKQPVSHQIGAMAPRSGGRRDHGDQHLSQGRREHRARHANGLAAPDDGTDYAGGEHWTEHQVEGVVLGPDDAISRSAR